jgi:hypothetical protein
MVLFKDLYKDELILKKVEDEYQLEFNMEDHGDDKVILFQNKEQIVTLISKLEEFLLLEL